jgi:phosphomevalonate kinase
MPEASAPGKLIIVGEYAVLEGSPAIATAVDVRARATIEASNDRDSLLIDPVRGETFRFRLDARTGLQWRGESPGPRGAILEAVFATLKERMPHDVPPLAIRLDTAAFYSARNDAASVKLGLGSSAAVLVALVGAFMCATGMPANENGTSMLALCCDAHRRFQGGLGSGVDVATALTGGTIGVRPAGLSTLPDTTALRWPDGLLMLPVWSGFSASTSELIGRFNAYRERAPDAFRTRVGQLATIAEAANAAWLTQSTSEVIQALASYDATLRSMDQDGSLGINTAAHEVLRGLSERHGAVYKTSGAGGGDFGLALSDSPSVINELRRAFVSGGYQVLDGSGDADGLTVVDQTGE